MPFAILITALLLFVPGFGAFLMGYSLLPTDAGRMWVSVGATFIAAGGLAMALGFATRAVTAARPVEAAAPVAVPPLPAAAPEPEIPAGSSLASPSLASPSLAGLPLAPVAAGLAAGGGALIATRALHAGEEDLAPPAKAEEETDLFLAALPPAMPAPEPPEEGHKDATPEPAAKPVGEDEAFSLRLGPIEEPAPEPEAEPAPAEPAPVPGLIADEDLAALQDDTPPLAPLETLEVVGAYDSAGVRFTMYSDGSVNAVGPAGSRRYRSLEALRARLDGGEPAI